MGKFVLLELGGKNVLIVYFDSDLKKIVDVIVVRMNFGWCGQFCGLISCVFLYEDIYDEVIFYLVEFVERYKLGVLMDFEIMIGMIVSCVQFDWVMGFIDFVKSEGVCVVIGGYVVMDSLLVKGSFIVLMIFVDVMLQMCIVCEEIFGLVFVVCKWLDEDFMLNEVNVFEFGLFCVIWIWDLVMVYCMVVCVEVGFVWVNEVGWYFFGVLFGGVK